MFIKLTIVNAFICDTLHGCSYEVIVKIECVLEDSVRAGPLYDDRAAIVWALWQKSPDAKGLHHFIVPEKKSALTLAENDWALWLELNKARRALEAHVNRLAYSGALEIELHHNFDWLHSGKTPEAESFLWIRQAAWKKLPIMACTVCGNLFQPASRRPNKYCSNRCRYVAHGRMVPRN
ncbi:hypothetical protein [Limibacillus sp. MBR-115]|uniref:hypothetical protein n=1 Tax=Limibacillus sp. MBR-115 TaxID=3156465 RepID=UPI0033948D06